MIATRFSELKRDMQQELSEKLSYEFLEDLKHSDNFEADIAKISSVHKITLINNTYSIYTLETPSYKFEVIGVEYDKGSFPYEIKFYQGVSVTSNIEMKVESFNELPSEVQEELYAELRNLDETFNEFCDDINEMYETLSEFIKAFGYLNAKEYYYYLQTKSYELRFNSSFIVNIIKK